ncbi:MAG: sugar phosphate isomerase/epimerase [Spirochaetales bacterium]|nr:sugar phosphate isomerase/epimerase [Spirochaetales bacterium]
MEFGAHAFVWEGEWNETTGRRVISEAARIGLDFVEIPLLHPDRLDASGTKRLLDDHGIYATYSLGLPAEASLPERPAEAEDFLRRALDAVAEAGGTTLTGVIYGTLGALPGRPPAESDYRVIAVVLSRVAEYAERRGIRLGIEPVNRYETFLINTAEQARDLLDRIDSPTMFIHLDTYHLNIEEESYAAAIRLAGPRMGYIHLSESHRGTPGTGTVDWDDVFTGLKEIGFTGALVMESFVRLNPDIARATCMWRDIVKDPEALIRDGVTFLTAKAREYELA